LLIKVEGLHIIFEFRLVFSCKEFKHGDFHGLDV